MENDKIINGILKSPDMVALTSLMDFFTLPEKELTIDLQGEPYTYTPLRIAKTESDFSELLSHLANRRNYSDTEIAKTLIADEIEALLRESKDQYVRPKSTLKDKSLIELAYKFLGWLSVTDQREPVAEKPKAIEQLSDICLSKEAEEGIYKILIDNKWIDPVTKYRLSSMNISKLIRFLKACKAKGYYYNTDRKITNIDYLNIANNTFKCNTTIDTIKTSHEVDNKVDIPYFT